MARVELRGLTRRFASADAAALTGLDLDASDGELVVLVGPSGCGKSTALRLIAGLDAPTSGKILLDGEDMTHVPPQDRDIAMVFQGYALYPHLTARENIAFPLKMRGASVKDRKARVDEAAELLGITRLLERRPGELSGGERQRVAMGRAIVRKPRVFLFDEPLSNLDASLRAELRVEIAALIRRLGVTSLYVTHDQVEAMTMADRIVVLRGGELQQVGPPRAIYEDPANTFVAGFLGAPPINWIELEARDGRLEGAGVAWPLPAGSAARSLTVGLRAEHLTLAGDGFSIPATVTSSEPLGAETHLHCDAAGTKLRAKAPGFDAPRRGAEVRLFPDIGRALFFEPGGPRWRPRA